MHRTLLVERPARGDAEALRRAFRGDPAAWLPDLTKPGADPATWQVYLWAGQIGGLVQLTLDGWSGTGPTVSRRIRWDAGRWLGLRLIPSFDGDLALRGRNSGPPLLVLRGEYRPPAGLFGWVADRLFLRRVADHTAAQLAEEIAERLTTAAQRDAGDDDARESATRDAAGQEDAWQTTARLFAGDDGVPEPAARPAGPRAGT